jgi:hypothetical protein
MIVELSRTADGGLRALQRQMIPTVYLDLVCHAGHCRRCCAIHKVRGGPASSAGVPASWGRYHI